MSNRKHRILKISKAHQELYLVEIDQIDRLVLLVDALVGRGPTRGGDGGEVRYRDVSGLAVVGSAVVGGGGLGCGRGALSGWTNGSWNCGISGHGLSGARSDVGVLVVDIAEVLSRARSAAVAAVLASSLGGIPAVDIDSWRRRR